MPVTKYRDQEVDFRRIWAGIGFPGQQPGFITIIGEQHRLIIHPYQQTVHFRLIAEYESWDVEELLNKTILFRADHQVSAFFGRTSRENDYSIRDFNDKGYDKRLPWVDIREAPLVDTEGDRGRIGYHINALRTLIKDGILHKNELQGSALHRYLMEIPQANLQEITDKQHPAVASLSYVCVALSELGEDQDERQMVDEANSIIEDFYD